MSKLREMIKRIIKEEQDWMSRDDQSRQSSRLNSESKKVLKLVNDKYSRFVNSGKVVTASDLRDFLEEKEPNFVNDWYSIDFDSILDLTRWGN